MNRTGWILGIALAVIGYDAAIAASFDCTKAKSKHEVLICTTPELNQADEQMGQIYKAVDAAFPLKGFLRANQSIFLLDYRSCANDKAKDKGAAACLALVKGRISDLQDIGAAKVFATDQKSFDPSDAVILLGERAGKAYLRIFGSWMPDAYRPKPFPDGFICNEEFELVRSAKGFSVKDVDWDLRITDQVIEAEFYSCSPRNGVSGSFKRLR